MQTIMVVDDDQYIGDMLDEALHKAGFDTIRAFSGTEVIYILEKQTPDLVLLDLMLPGLSGEQLLPKLEGIPVIVVSAKIEIDNKVKLLLQGAVDYVTKPFHIEELLARISVHLRSNVQTEQKATLTYDVIQLDLEGYTVSLANTPVMLTKTEYAILKLLMQNPKQVITKSQMLDQISMDTPDCTESSLKVHMSNLRKKLREINGIDYIESIWGIGFKLRDLNSLR